MSKVKILKFTFGEEECIRILKEAYEKEWHTYFAGSSNASYTEAYVDLVEVIGLEEVNKLYWELWANDDE